MSPIVNIHSRTPYFYPGPVVDEDGAVVEPGVYVGMMCSIDVILEDGVRSGQQVVDVPQDATDEDISAAVLALYGVV